MRSKMVQMKKENKLFIVLLARVTFLAVKQAYKHI